MRVDLISMSWRYSYYGMLIGDPTETIVPSQQRVLHHAILPSQCKIIKLVKKVLDHINPRASQYISSDFCHAWECDLLVILVIYLKSFWICPNLSLGEGDNLAES